MEKQKIAFLVLAHKNQEQINALSKELQKSGDVYIHLDLKSDIERSKLDGAVLPKEKSYDISWGSNDMIRATIALMKMAYAVGGYSHYFLVSGQDMPIVPAETIKDIVEPDKNYIQMRGPEDSDYTRVRKLHEVTYSAKMTGPDVKSVLLKKFYMLLTGGFRHTWPFLRRKIPAGMNFRFGSQWWCLSAECVGWMLEYLDNHPEYVEFFEGAIIPDECFFQTLIWYSPFKYKIEKKLTFVNWRGGRRSPDTLTKEDEERICKAAEEGYVMGRKFDFDVYRPEAL